MHAWYYMQHKGEYFSSNLYLRSLHLQNYIQEFPIKLLICTCKYRLSQHFMNTLKEKKKSSQKIAVQGPETNLIQKIITFYTGTCGQSYSYYHYRQIV